MASKETLQDLKVGGRVAKLREAPKCWKVAGCGIMASTVSRTRQIMSAAMPATRAKATFLPSADVRMTRLCGLRSIGDRGMPSWCAKSSQLECFLIDRTDGRRAACAEGRGTEIVDGVVNAFLAVDIDGEQQWVHELDARGAFGHVGVDTGERSLWHEEPPREPVGYSSSLTLVETIPTAYWAKV
jgi:hypothetical protein